MFESANDITIYSIQRLMQIISDSGKDVRSRKPSPGSYEWWYFDAASHDGTYSLVVIFYDGNPFSRRYADALKRGEKNLAKYYPAVSISVYKGSSPVFYSFEEVLPEEALFSAHKPEGFVKGNRFVKVESGDKLVYRLTLDQRLPGGDHLSAELTFTSQRHNFILAENQTDSGGNEKHSWNLVQPYADVEGLITVSGYSGQKIKFSGRGYHDHNTGNEPMHRSFSEWYWGRIHFAGGTLAYYLMNENNVLNSKGWLFDESGNVTLMDGITTDDIGLNKFGLHSARKIEKKDGDIRFLIQKNEVVDDGPFYQRFLNRMVLQAEGRTIQGQGISEYIYPSRIHTKLFRPLVNMRIQYPGRAHWVQKNPRLYRWTW